jgi:hypothetical protein
MMSSQNTKEQEDASDDLVFRTNSALKLKVGDASKIETVESNSSIAMTMTAVVAGNASAAAVAAVTETISCAVTTPATPGGVSSHLAHSSKASHRSGSISSANSKPNGLILPWDKFSYWVNAVLVVTFDIEMGQSLEAVYPSPSHVKLTQAEKSNICYMSFPDSNSGFLGDTQYHFRLKQDTHAHSALTSNKTISSNLTSIANMHYSGSAVTANTNTNATILPTFSRNINYEEYNRKTLDGLEVSLLSSYFPDLLSIS